MSQHCSHCRAPLETGLVNVNFTGSPRRLMVHLRNVPTPMCPDCQTPIVTQATWERLLYLGPGPGSGWEMRVEPVRTDAA